MKLAARKTEVILYDSDFSESDNEGEDPADGKNVSLDALGFPEKLQRMLNKEPKDHILQAKAKWKELGPLKLENIVKYAAKDTEIKYTNELGRCKTNLAVLG